MSRSSVGVWLRRGALLLSFAAVATGPAPRVHAQSLPLWLQIRSSYVDPSSGRSLELHPRTQAWVQRVSQADYLSLIEGGVASPQPSGSTVAASIRDGFENDPAGWVLQDQLITEIAGAGSLRPRIESLQKRDDLAYARVETVLPNVEVGGQQLAEYYWDREWFIVRTAQDLFLVKLFVADDDHRSPDYGAISAWLDQLRILGS